MTPKRLKKDVMRQTFSSIWWVFKVYWKMSPLLTSMYFVTQILIELISIATSYVFARGIDILINTAETGTSLNGIYFVVGLFFVFSVLSAASRQLSNYADRTLNTMFTPMYHQMLYTKLIKIGVQKLESPSVNNLIERSRRNSHYLSRVFGELSSFVADLVAISGSAAILFAFAPHLIPIFIIVLLPATLIDSYFLKKTWQYNRDTTEESRSAYESAGYLQNSVSLSELLITDGVSKLKKSFEDFSERWLRGLSKLRKKWYTSIFATRVVRSVVEIYSDLYVFRSFLVGRLSIGQVTFYIGQVTRFAGGINSIASVINRMYEATLNINDTRELLEMEEIEDGNVSIERTKEGPSISLSEVTFRYPNTERNVIHNLSLDIKSGEKIAIVGHNGAGKTTLIKILLRFYKVNEGSVLINSININDLKINDLYKNVSVLFQDYNTYSNLTAEENIVIGDLRRKGKKKDIIHAANQADAHDFIEEYDHGYDQLLSEKYRNGVRPSTGQWQKLAIARFFYRRASLIIFDEPTAAIDAVSEAKIFDKIYTFFKKKTVIIISHRFSTVRNADRILVLDKGKIIEDGNHEDLMKLNGKYAKAFKLQAKGYK